MRHGPRPAGPEPVAPALLRSKGTVVLAAGQPVEVDRKVNRDGLVAIGGLYHQVEFSLARRVIAVRLDGHLMHAIADNALMGTWPCPVPADQLGRLRRARTAATPLPPPPLPTGLIRAQHKVYASGRIMVNRQFIKLGPRHAGRSSPSSSSTPTTGSSTAKTSSRSGPSRTPARSLASTSKEWAKRRSVKQLLTTSRQPCPETKRRQVLPLPEDMKVKPCACPWAHAGPAHRHQRTSHDSASVCTRWHQPPVQASRKSG